MRTTVALVLWFAIVAILPGVVDAQTSGSKPRGKSLKDGITTYGDPPMKAGSKSTGKKPPATSVTVELLTGKDGLGMKSRDWIEMLGKLDVVVTARNGMPDDKLGVFESKAGITLRTVRVVAALDGKGRLMLPDQTFTLDDAGKISAWIKDLKVYGAQGNPGGQPVWGLTKEQFGVIHTALKKPLAAETKDVAIAKVVTLFDLPKEHPITFTTAAARLLKERGERAQVSQSLTGVSQGTALAVLLAEQRMGFRPHRLPDGKIELSVATLEEARDAWPVGWPREREIPDTAPALLQIKTIDLDEEPLDQILDAISGQIRLPILIDRAGLEAKQIDLSEIKITYPLKKTTWITALKEFSFKAKAKVEVLLDEAGQPFLYVVPLDTPSRAAQRMSMFTGDQIVTELLELGITHVVWLPDSALGQWEPALQQASGRGIQLVRVCREGEAWAIAMGLELGGARPLVMIQCTGLFDSGDSLRCALFDYGVPLFAVIGYRNALNPAAVDSARTFTEPNLRSWNIGFRLIDAPEKLPELKSHYIACREARVPGVVLVAEGRM